MTEQSSSQNYQYLTFTLSEDIYAINILKIKEILEYQSLTPVPLTPNFIRGVLNLRGKVLPVIDLVARFGGSPTIPTKRTCIIIVEILIEANDQQDPPTTMDLGVVVDMVNRVVDLTDNDIEPPPSFGAKIRVDFIAGMGKLDDFFMILLDITRVLSVEELMIVDAINDELSHQTQP
jgi:purine-binding chemotaxis protein CheW